MAVDVRGSGSGDSTAHPHFPEGTEVKSTGESGGTKFLREDGDGTCSWQAPSAHTPEGTAVKSTGESGGTKFLREDGDGTSSWQAAPAANSSYVTTITWIDYTTGSHGTGLTFSDSGGDAATNDYDTIQFTHGLDSTDVIVDVVELTSTVDYYNQQNAGMDMGHSAHVIAVRDGSNTCKLIFNGANEAGATYRVLVMKVG